MKIQHVFWVICSMVAFVSGAPKPAGDNATHGKKDIDDLAEEGSGMPTGTPEVELEAPESPSNTKTNSQSLFLNKNDKNDLEPYPMALSDDASYAYDGRPVRAGEAPLGAAAEAEPHPVLMRAELYGEPPSMGTQAARNKRAPKRIQKRTSRYSAINRFKRDSGVRSEDILALLSLWEAQQRHNNEMSPSYYGQDSYYNNQVDPYDDNSNDRDSSDEKWLDGSVVPSSHYFSYPFYQLDDLHKSLQNKPNYEYSRESQYPEYIPEDQNYLQNLDALRRKRQWAGFSNKNRLAKRFMVARKRSEIPMYMPAQKSIKPREDMYSLSELLKSAQGIRDPSIPLSRRLVL